MEALLSASKEGNIDKLYAAILHNPRILSMIDEIPFVDTPLHIAADSGHVEFALEIMRLKPSFAKKCNPEGFTPIHIAIQKKCTQMVVCFVEMDPGLVRVKGKEGMTPLHVVVREGNLVLLQSLVSGFPESIGDVNVWQETALHVALKNSMFEAFQLLLDMLRKDSNEEINLWKKRVVNCRDSDGNTVLHISTLRNQFQIAESLVTYNKSNPGMLQLNATNERNQTAMDIALNSQHQHIHRLLSQMVANDVEIEVTNHVSPEETHSSDWEKYLKFYLRKSSPDKTRTVLLITAILMAMGTYQAVLNPPGGADTETGIALLSKHGFRYGWFMVSNTIGFFISMHIIVLLMRNYPFYWELYVAILAIQSAYDATMISITPSGNMRLLFLIVSIVMPIIIPPLSFLLRKFISKRKQRGLANNSHVNA